MNWKKIQNAIDVFNTYYGFAVLLYAAVLYAASHSFLFFWLLLIITPLLAGWTGYLLRTLTQRRNERHGFRLLEEALCYEIGRNHSYILQSTAKIKAAADHLMVYPLGYQWTGKGREELPEIAAEGQQLLGVVERRAPESQLGGHEAGHERVNYVAVAPEKIRTSTQGDWQYWFVALNPPVHRGQVVELQYSQRFHDSEGAAKPCLYYFVRTPMKRLELNVKFPLHALPKRVDAEYVKPADSSRPYTGKGLHFDPDKQWASWVIERPKRGYCYRIEWQ